jgi:RHS repeat-associated protein
VYYWQRRDTDAYDHTLSETLGNGLANTYTYDSRTGRPVYITTHKASEIFNASIAGSTEVGRNVRMLGYQYDNHNNVTYRYDEQLGITDRWTYDALDRVESNSISLVDKTSHGLNNPDLLSRYSYQYDAIGNIKFKTGVGNYEYSGRNAGSHAVTKAGSLNYAYDANGNLSRAWHDGSSVSERQLEWSATNKPTKIVRNGSTVEFFYDANDNRYMKKSSKGVVTFYFGKTYERIIDSHNDKISHRHFVYADGKLIAINTQQEDSEGVIKDKQIRYLHYDALNSVDMITDGFGNIIERHSYDTWGKQRGVVYEVESSLKSLAYIETNRGYTGHEQIDEVDLVHMNGRVYDADLGRFMSADPLVSSPYMTNSFNRYSYVSNNPLKYTDPTGLYSWDDFKSDVKSAFEKVGDFFSGGRNNESGRSKVRSNSEKSQSSYGVVENTFTGGETSTIVVDDNDFADYAAGKLSIVNEDGVIDTRILTLEFDEDAEQSLDVHRELSVQSRPKDTIVTDVTVSIGVQFARLGGAPGVTAAELTGTLLKASEKVKIKETEKVGVSYKEMSQKAIYFGDGKVYGTGARTWTGRHVVHYKTTSVKFSSINVRELKDDERFNLEHILIEPKRK